MVDDPGSGRGFFRFRRSALDRIVGDRELMLRQAEQRAREAEERAKRLEEELRSGGTPGATNGAGSASASALRESVSRRAARAPGLASLTPGQVDALVAAIVSAAEEAASRLAGRSPNGGVDHLDPKELHREVGAAAARIRRPDPAVRDARETLGQVRRAVQDLPDRLVEALKPLAESVREADARLARLEDRDRRPEPRDSTQ